MLKITDHHVSGFQFLYKVRIGTILDHLNPFAYAAHFCVSPVCYFKRYFLQDLFITGTSYDTPAQQKQQSAFSQSDKNPEAKAPGNQAELPAISYGGLVFRAV